MSNVMYNVPENRGLGGLLKSVFLGRGKPQYGLGEVNESMEYIEAVKNAKIELENIDKLFNNTSDPDLIEYAIYEQYAAKLKFSYLIKKIKDKKITLENYSFL
jgi:hypothetical protein